MPDTRAQTVDICDRTAEVEAEILDEIDVSGLTCDAVTSAQLSSVSTLDLSNKSITSLDEDDFDGLSGLATLYLNNNSLSSLHEELFDGLSSLTTLSLQRNSSLSSLDEELFDGLSSLVTLNLNNNSLSSLEEDLFDGLSSLETLNLRSNSLSSLHEDIFDGLSSLVTLTLDGNSLTSLHVDIFDGLSSLVTMDLSSNSLGSPPADLFDGLSSLTTLDLSFSGLTSLDKDLFDGLSSLTTLYLYFNSLTSLDEDLFDGLASLVTLSLHFNSLSSLPGDLFDGLSSLVTLNLNNNSLSSLPGDLFDGLSSIVTLNLSSNSLTSLDEDLLNGLSSLTTLNLRTNSLSSLPANIFEGIEGLSVELGRNPIICLPQTIVDLVNEGKITITGYSPIVVCTTQEVVLMLTSTVIPEAGGSTAVTAKLDAKSGAVTTVEVSVVPDSPASTSDYTLSSNTTLTIAAGELLSTGVVTITAVDNSIDAPDKTYQVGGTAQNAIGVTGPSGVTLTITDDDEASGITLMVVPSKVNEDAGRTDVMVTATLDAARGTDTEVTVAVGDVTASGRTGSLVVITDTEVTVGDNTAVAGTDYSAVSSFDITISANQLSGAGSFAFTPIPDDIDEPNERVLITGATPVEGFAVTGTTLTILDENPSPEVTLVLTPATIVEAGGRTVVTATLSAVSSAETTVAVSVVPDSPATTSDYAVSQNTTLTIAANTTTSTGEVTITAVDNTIDLPDKMFQVGGSAQNVQGVIGPSNVTLTIADDDEASEITLTVAPSEVNEDAGSMDVVVTAKLDAVRSTDTDVTVMVGDGTAVAGTDYSAVSSIEITILANQFSGAGTFAFVPTADDIDEPDETVLITGMTSVGVLAVTGTTLTITDEDPSPTMTLTLSPATISEAGGVSTVTASLDRPSSEETTVTIFAEPQDLRTLFDYRLSANPMLTIAAGSTISIGEVTITAIDNQVDTADRKVMVQGTAVNAQGIPPSTEVVLTIIDDDEATGVALAVAPSEVNEDAGSTAVTVTATLDVARGADTEVTVSVGDGIAAAGTDYSAVSSFDITISADQISGAGRFTITPTPDNIDEPDETVLVTGTTPVEGMNVTGTVLMLTDEDPAPVATLTVSPASISEAGGVSTVTARLDRPSSEETAVTITVQPQEPATTSDYSLSSNRTLTIAAGATTSTGEVTITAVDNDVHTADKMVTVQGAATNAQGITPPAEIVLTITNQTETAPVARDVTVTAIEDTPYRFQVSDFGYSDPDGDPLRGVRITARPQVGTLTLEGTEVVANTLVAVEQIGVGALVFVPVVDGYGLPYTSFTFQVSDGTLESHSSATLTVVVESVNDAATGQPEILGYMQVGEPLRVSTQEITDVDGTSNAERGSPPYNYRYQWFRMKARQPLPISGADADTYVPVAADVGARLVVRVRFLDDAGFSEDLSSSPREVLQTGRIRQAWMARFGRVVADQILEATACDGRQSRPGPNGVYLAGHPVALSSLPHYVRLKRKDLDSIVPSSGESGPVMTHTLIQPNLVRGTSFRHVGNPEADQGVTFWGQGARSRFQGSENASKIDGVITSGMVGANWRRHGISLGVLANYTNADGGYDFGSDSGQVSGRLTGVYPNVCYVISSRVRVWAVTGYGRGDLTLDGGGARRFQSPLHLMMGGGGVYGRVRTIASRLELGLRSDALVVRTTASQTEALSRDVAQMTRLRLGLKGTVRGMQLGRDVRIEPALEIAVRHDGGDADTGFGIDMSAGLVVSTSTRGLSMEVQARGVLTHQAPGLHEQGMVAAVIWDPTPYSESGIHVRLEQTMGTEVFGGTDRLLRAETLETHFMDASDSGKFGPGDFRLEAGYGFKVLRGRLVTQPEVGLEWRESRRRYQMGWEFAFAHTNPTHLRLFVGATGRDSMTEKTQFQHQIRLQLRRIW
ncbi:MAG: leucine-rich repeat protein [Rhodothermaceae bacterium]|nr:leucine-rich repeat protein [Rhodothermaceae bacterium]MYJ48951.1 leucine-rich repeat protein [Rhodothermaceae bacterium]MYK64745.1 leucine-rich repeat protein [Rhodothermaceae bacterium]